MTGTIRQTLSSILVSLGLISPAMAGVSAGDTAPSFHLQDQKGKWHSLEQYNGRWVVLYFYPKDNTPGCTKEACGFRDNIYAFEDIGAVILGISLDDVESHEAFAEKYDLPFSLLSDADTRTAVKYGVLKKMGPLTFAKRQSFIIDPSGKIARHYQKVDAENHSKQVLADLKALLDNG